MNTNNFLKERNDALLSLDRTKIEAYMRKYGVKIPTNDEVFWGSVHKARTAMTSFPEEERQKSRDWLKEHNWSSLG